MNTITALIIESNVDNIFSIVNLLQKVNSGINVIATATTIMEGEKLIYQHHPSVVFLSVDMPGIDSLNVLDNMHFKDFELIFLITNNLHCIENCHHHPLDCLHMPLEEKKLRIAVSSLHLILEQKFKEKVPIEASNLATQLTVHCIGQKYFINHKDILYIESDNSYTHFHLLNDKIITSCKNLKYYEAYLQLIKRFFRAHKQHIINLDYVESFLEEDGGMAVMINGLKLPVSQRNREEFLAAMEL